jgi:serine/threonine protein kinase
MEYIALGDLGSHIAGLLSETDILQIAHDVVLGLKIMHSHGFTHRDLKPGVCF